jgi:hypothetical protein
VGSKAKSSKKKQRAKEDASQQATNNSAADNGTVSVEGSPEEAKKQKKYEKKVKVRLAGAVSNFLVLNVVSFRARYEGDGVYTFRVGKDQKSMLDDLCERLKE